jgi:hypothetical protein
MIGLTIICQLFSAMASSSSRPGYGIIILGNSGVGKSFLANILLGREAFVHRVAPRAVTTKTEFEEIPMGNENYAIFNIPGLIEADKQRIEMNKHEIDKAFVERPTSLILYVFGEQGGRIRDEDVVAFNALNKAYLLKPESLVLIVNGVAKDRDKDYEGQVIVLLEELIKVRFQSLCVLDKIEKNNEGEKENLKNKLLQVIVERTPRDHFKKQDIELQREEVRKAKEEIKTLQKKFQENRQTHENQIKEQQAMYDRKFSEILKENEQMRHLIERQADEQKQRDAAHQKAIWEANEQMRRLALRQAEEQKQRDAAHQKAIQEANARAVRLQAEKEAEQRARVQEDQRAREQAAQRAREQAEQMTRQQAQQASKSISSITEKLFSQNFFRSDRVRE